MAKLQQNMKLQGLEIEEDDDEDEDKRQREEAEEQKKKATMKQIRAIGAGTTPEEQVKKTPRRKIPRKSSVAAIMATPQTKEGVALVKTTTKTTNSSSSSSSTSSSSGRSSGSDSASAGPEESDSESKATVSPTRAPETTTPKAASLKHAETQRMIDYCQANPQPIKGPGASTESDSPATKATGPKATSSKPTGSTVITAEEKERLVKEMSPTKQTPKVPGRRSTRNSDRHGNPKDPAKGKKRKHDSDKEEQGSVGKKTRKGGGK